MITISEILNSIIQESPLLEEGLAEGLINLSALSRKVQPQIEATLMRPVSESAILMALKRLSDKLTPKIKLNKNLISQLGDLTVRSDLSEFTFQRSNTILEKQKMLLHGIREKPDPFVTFTQGVYEITTIVNSTLEKMVETIFRDEKIVAKILNLSAITLRLSTRSADTPGIYYTVLKHLAWNNINVVEVVATYTEFTIILQNNQLDTSFSALVRLLSRKKNPKYLGHNKKNLI